MSNYYETLSLDESHCGRPLSDTELKQAYRQALLHHHPDKEGRCTAKHSANGTGKAVTVDDITKAYKTLADIEQRAEYDRILLQQRAKTGDAPNGRIHHTGLETVDLDSLDFDDSTETWTRSCRCGDRKGFVVTESELEKHAEHGELMIGCKGCSLWLRVLFGVEDGG